MTPKKVDILRAIKRVGQHGAHFHSRDIREVLKIAASNRNAAARIYNTLQGAVKDGIVEEIASNRKRNRYYHILDNEKLKEITAWRTGTSNGSSGIGPADRLTRIEIAIHGLEERLDQIDGKLAELLDIWS